MSPMALAFLCIADNCRCKTMQTNTRISKEFFLLVGRLEIVTDKLRTICGDFDCIIWVYIKYRIYTIRIFTLFVFSFSSHRYSESISKQFLTSVLDSSRRIRVLKAASICFQYLHHRQLHPHFLRCLHYFFCYPLHYLQLQPCH